MNQSIIVFGVGIGSFTCQVEKKRNSANWNLYFYVLVKRWHRIERIVFLFVAEVLSQSWFHSKLLHKNYSYLILKEDSYLKCVAIKFLFSYISFLFILFPFSSFTFLLLFRVLSIFSALLNSPEPTRNHPIRPKNRKCFPFRKFLDFLLFGRFWNTTLFLWLADD